MRSRAGAGAGRSAAHLGARAQVTIITDAFARKVRPGYPL